MLNTPTRAQEGLLSLTLILRGKPCPIPKTVLALDADSLFAEAIGVEVVMVGVSNDLDKKIDIAQNGADFKTMCLDPDREIMGINRNFLKALVPGVMDIKA